MTKSITVPMDEIVLRQRLSYVAVVLTLCVAAFAGLRAESRRAEAQAAEAARAAAEGKRDEALKKFTLLVESSPWALIVCNEKGTIENVNAAAERMLGWSASEMVGKNSEFLIVPAEYRAAHEAAIKNAADKLRQSDGDWLLTSNRREVQSLTKSGEIITAIVTVRAIKFNNKIEFILSLSSAAPPSGEPLKLNKPERITDVVQGIVDRNPSLSGVLNQAASVIDDKHIDTERKD